MKARVFGTLKEKVLDPQGQAVAATLQKLGFDEVAGVRVGKYIELDLGEENPARAKERAESMCERLLANPVIESYRVEVD